MSKIEKLCKYSKKIAKYQQLSSLLSWELRVVSPEDAKEEILDLKNEYDVKVFKLKTDKKYKKLIEEAIDSDEFKKLDEYEQNHLKNLLIDYEESALVPEKAFKEFTKFSEKCGLVWQEAKEKNDYELYKPYLKKMIEITKKYYSYINPDKDLYDVMLDQYERGITSKIIDPIFEELKKELIPLIQKIKQDKNLVIKADCSKDDLIKCGYFLLDYIGFDTKKGIIDVFPHGYTDKMTSNDVRIAFNYTTDPANFVTTIIHEGGHGIFEQKVSPKLTKYDNGFVQNYALHESQSRFYENVLGRNKNFWLPIYDDIKKILHFDAPLEDFIRSLNCVRPSLIRTEADEVTYCLHIILRYEIEKEIFRNNLSVDELPKLWSQKTKEYFGLDITEDKDGIMQDIHWSQGDFGYFPSYLMGNVYDGMLIEAIEDKLGSIDTLLKEGKIKEITKFLNENIHFYGGTYPSVELIENICGKHLSAEPFVNYLKDKFKKDIQ